MEVSRAKSDVKDVVSRLLSRDPVVFNSTINAHFAASCTYRGHGLHIQGASNLKHAAFLLNLVDIGRAATIEDRHVHWDASSTTAHVKATRFLRPRLFPLFQFAVPTELTLKFNPSSSGSSDVNASDEKNQLLYCTSFEDAWPLDALIQSLPVISFLYTTFWTPVATLLVLQLSNLVFLLHGRLGSWDRRVVDPTLQTYSTSVEPRLPSGLRAGFDQGKRLAEELRGPGIDAIVSIARGPLYAVQTAAQATTRIANSSLPSSLQLPYPSIFNDDDSVLDTKHEREGVLLFSDTGSFRPRLSGSQQMPEIRLSPSEEQPPSYPSHLDEARKEEDRPAEGQERSGTSTSSTASTAVADPQRTVVAEGDEQGTAQHAKVVVGQPDAADAGEQAKEIDLVTHEVTEARSQAQEQGSSLYSQLKAEDELQKPLEAAEKAQEEVAAAAPAAAAASEKTEQSAGNEAEEEEEGNKAKGNGGSSGNEGAQAKSTHGGGGSKKGKSKKRKGGKGKK